jgi:hypothetical protein
MSRTASTASPVTSRVFSQASGSSRVEEKTTLSMADSAVMSSSPDSTNPAKSR